MVDGAARPPDFDSLYRDDDDPWRVESSWYERRKAAILLAVLPQESYGRIWEPGCGPGVISSLLAGRTDSLLSSDASPVAIEHARQRCGDRTNVTFVVSALPDVALRERFDLVVAAEFLYYVADLPPALDALWSCVAPGGQLACMHWAHDPHDAYCSGRDLHATIALDATSRNAPRLISHLDRDFMLDVYESPS